MGKMVLVRYGRMGYIGRFAVDEGSGKPLDHGETVVVRTRRGTELGEVLTFAPQEDSPSIATGTVLRRARPEDHGLARRLEAEQQERFTACDRIFGEGTWPLMLVDVEPLLDEARTVIYYLGPHHLDDAGLREALRDKYGIDAILEPVGRDLALDSSHAGTPTESADDSYGGCGGCGTSEGCGSGGCATGTDGATHTRDGCSGCSVKDLVRRRMVV